MGLVNMIFGRNQAKVSKQVQESIDRDLAKRKAVLKSRSKSVEKEVRNEIRLLNVVGAFSPDTINVFSAYSAFLKQLLNETPDGRDSILSRPDINAWQLACGKRVHLLAQALEYVFPDDPIWEKVRHHKFTISDFGDVE